MKPPSPGNWRKLGEMPDTSCFLFCPLFLYSKSENHEAPETAGNLRKYRKLVFVFVSIVLIVKITKPWSPINCRKLAEMTDTCCFHSFHCFYVQNHETLETAGNCQKFRKLVLFVFSSVLTINIYISIRMGEFPTMHAELLSSVWEIIRKTFWPFEDICAYSSYNITNHGLCVCVNSFAVRYLYDSASNFRVWGSFAKSVAGLVDPSWCTRARGPLAITLSAVFEIGGWAGGPELLEPSLWIRG